MRVLQAALLYFLVVFAAGFGCGTVRTLLLEPRLGKTIAVAIELPFLIIAMIAGSLWAPRRVGLAPSVAALLGVGFGAFALQQLADFAVGYWLRGMDFAAQIAALRTPAGMLYLAGLAAFVLMPLLVWRVRRR